MSSDQEMPSALAQSDVTKASPGQQQQGAVDHGTTLDREPSASELSKWSEIIDHGVAEYMRSHPKRFQRRVRRGIPRAIRWQVWKVAARLDEIEMPKEDYGPLSTRPNDWTSAIETDIARTFPEIQTFDAAQQQRLLRVLNAYAGHNPKLGYCQGMNFVAGLLLLVSDSEEESFEVFLCLMDHPHFGLSGFYRDKLPRLRRYLQACDILVQETMPELSEHFRQENVQPAMYLHQWFITLFINSFPLPMVEIIWDVIMCEGLPAILRIAVSILHVLKDSLLSMHFEEIIRFFKMMRTYDDNDGELDAFRIGQLLVKQTEQVQIPDRTLEYINSESGTEDGGPLDIDAHWDAELAEGSWLPFVPRMIWPFGSARRRELGGGGDSIPSTGSEPALPAPSAMQVPATPAAAPVMQGSSGGPAPHPRGDISPITNVFKIF